MLLRKPVLFFGISVVGWCIAQSALAATFTVNSPEATDDGTCTHPYVDAANDCTLEEAIDDANAAGGSDTVNFNISTANFASAILLEAGLSFLGIGVQPPMPSWGTMIREHYGYIILDMAYLAIIPGIAIMLMVLAFMLLGNSLRDILDVKTNNLEVKG